MTTVPYADLCDAPLNPPQPDRAICHARSEEYSNWPFCRACMAHTCPDHTVPGSSKEHDREDAESQAYVVVDVYCVACLAENGPEDTPDGFSATLKAMNARGIPFIVRTEDDSAEPSDLDTMGRFERFTS